MFETKREVAEAPSFIDHIVKGQACHPKQLFSIELKYVPRGNRA